MIKSSKPERILFNCLAKKLVRPAIQKEDTAINIANLMKKFCFFVIFRRVLNISFPNMLKITDM